MPINDYSYKANRRSGIIVASSGFDPDAEAFWTAAGISNSTEQAAINQLVLDLKGTGSTTNNTNQWAKHYALYPISPTSLAAAAYNLKDPTAFQITWFNSPTHAATGVTGNGTNQYGDTGFNVDTEADLDNFSFGFNGVKSTTTDMGCRTNDTNYTAFNNLSVYGSCAGFSSNATLNTSREFRMVQRPNSTTQEIYQGSNTANATDSKTSSTKPPYNMFLLALNNAGSPLNYATGEKDFFFISQSLTANEIQDLIDAINTYNTALSR